MKLYFYTLVFVCCSTFNGCSQEVDSYKNKLKGIEKDIESLIDQHHAAGLAVAVVKDGETIYSRGFGYRDYENKLPVDANTIFGIGSCTKAFTAAILGQLEDEGKLNLEDKPSEHFQSLQFKTKGMNDSIQIKNLLTHSTGINSWPSESTAILFITPNKYDLIPRVSHLKAFAGVGKEWIYNNLMYTLAGMVAEQASGRSLEDNWKERIFTPLNMTNTYVDWQPAVKNNNFSYGYAVDSIAPSRVLPEDMSTRAAGGSIYSTVSDMAKWMQFWLDEGRVGTTQLLSKNYIDEAKSHLVKMPDNPNDTIDQTTKYYGYGWANWNHRGYKRTEHSGGTSGYVSNVVLYPDENLGIVVLSNQTRSTLPSMTNNLIVEKLYPELKENRLEVGFGQVFDIAPINTPTIQGSEKPSFDLDKLVGEYTHPGFGKFAISLDDKTLYAHFPLTKFRLEYVGDDTFIDHFTEDIPQSYWSFMRFTFRTDDHSNISKVLINLDNEPVEFLKE